MRICIGYLALVKNQMRNRAFTAHVAFAGSCGIYSHNFLTTRKISKSVANVLMTSHHLHSSCNSKWLPILIRRNKLCNNTCRSQRTLTSGQALASYGKLIYVGDLNRTVKLVKLFTFSTSITALVTQPYFWFLLSTGSFSSGAKLVLSCFAAVSGALFFTPVLYHWVAKRYVTEIYYDETSELFTAVAYSFFLRRRVLRFPAVEVSDPGNAGMFTTALVYDKPLLFDTNPERYKDRNAYELLMGYDRKKQNRFPELSHYEVREQRSSSESGKAE